jgi:hypothetical protein
MQKPFATLLLSTARLSLSTVWLAAFSMTGTNILHAQSNFFDKWMARTTETQAKQPNWVPPVVTTYVGLIQVLRGDFTRQYSPTHTTTWNYGASKGVNLVPWANTEVVVNLPPYFDRNKPAPKGGAGDTSFLLKYRFLAGDAEKGNYVVSACLLATIPTGSYKNGSADASVAPTVLAGKGFGKLDIQSTLAGTLPRRSDARLPGIRRRNITWANISGLSWNRTRPITMAGRMAGKTRTS